MTAATGRNFPPARRSDLFPTLGVPALTQFLNDLFSTLVRLVMIVSGLVIAGLLLVAALVAGGGLLAWSKLTGRKPVLRFAGVDPFAAVAAMRARSAGAARPGPGAAPRRPQRVEVIDIEAREVPERRD